MDWRTSWYKADKNEPLTLTVDNGYTCPEINGEIVASNMGTEFCQNLKYNDPDFQKEIKCLFEDEDCDYYSITKEGFKRIILAYRDRIIKYQKQALENEENPELTKDWNRCSYTPKTLIESELREWEGSYLGDNDERCYFAIDLKDNSPLVSGSWKYKYAIFDMIFVYKTFDWDNYIMVVYGG